MDLNALTQKLVEELTPLSWEERITHLRNYAELFPAFSTSLSYDDQAITHVIAEEDIPIRVFAIDTGRLFEQTLEVLQKNEERYPNLQIETYYPNAEKTQNLIARQGINGFYDSIEKRKACCFTRKVEPLARALEESQIWMSGLRREHSDNRGDLPVAEYDAGRDIIKIYPIIDVSTEDLRAYIDAHNIPFNPMHDEGYPSIGCAPCTRAIKAGEHPRQGRWWWEQDDAQECGLHVVDGKLVRAKQTTNNQGLL